MVRKIQYQDFERFTHLEPSEYETGPFGVLFICLCICMRMYLYLC
jgi:hypothetical protein